MALMRDQRAQRCLVHSTLGFPSAITPDNAEQLLEEVRLSVASELRDEAERREAEIKRNAEQELGRIAKVHQDDILTREAKLLELEGALAAREAAAEREIDERERKIAVLGQRLEGVEKSIETDVELRVQKAAASARRIALALKAVLIIIYLTLVGCAYWFTPGDPVYALGVTVFVALLGFWIIPQITYEKLAKLLWVRRLRSRCEALGVLKHLSRYEVDTKNLRVRKK